MLSRYFMLTIILKSSYTVGRNLKPTCRYPVEYQLTYCLMRE